MSDLDRRSAMVMAGLGMVAVAIPTPNAGAVPAAPEPPLPPPPPRALGPQAPDPEAAVPGFFGDEFNGPAGSAPNPALWSVAQRRELIKNPVFWDLPENMGQYRDDR